jgi:protein phosphatase
MRHVREGVEPALRRAFQETNAGIYTIGQENPEFRGLGTTSTALILRPEGAWVAHVGDSRAYRIRDGLAEQLTFDHSWVWEIARRQGVDPDELGDFKKNVIIRSLGPDAEVEVDIEGPHPVRSGDIYLLCSDGLTGVVAPEDVGAVVSVLPMEDAAKLLVNLANLRGGPDNITVMIVQIGDGHAGPSKKAGGPGVLTRAIAAWNRRVPVPFTALAAGIVVAMLSLAMRMNSVPGATLLFLLAALIILAGLAGLVVHLRKEPEHVEVVNNAPRELHLYKKHSCPVTAELIDKFQQLEATLAQTMRDQGVAVDWDEHAKLDAAVKSGMEKGSEREVFAGRCRSLLFISEAFHKARQKEEAFRPSWTTPAPQGGITPQ